MQKQRVFKRMNITEISSRLNGSNVISKREKSQTDDIPFETIWPRTIRNDLDGLFSLKNFWEIILSQLQGLDRVH